MVERTYYYIQQETEPDEECKVQIAQIMIHCSAAG